jgi:hypothetical protein
MNIFVDLSAFTFVSMSFVAHNRDSLFSYMLLMFILCFDGPS